MESKDYKQILMNAYTYQELSIEDFENTLDHYVELEKKAYENNRKTPTISISFDEKKLYDFIEQTIMLNSQNLSGRETEEELYKQGIIDCITELTEKTQNKKE